jgi:hypothetical protein
MATLYDTILVVTRCISGAETPLIKGQRRASAVKLKYPLIWYEEPTVNPPADVAEMTQLFCVVLA